MTALQSQDPKVSPSGERRPHAVVCFLCLRAETLNIDARCDRCRKDET